MRAKTAFAANRPDWAAQRQRRLPTHIVVALVITMHVWSDHSWVDVLKNLVEEISCHWIRLSQQWKAPSQSSISEARQCVGPQVEDKGKLGHVAADGRNELTEPDSDKGTHQLTARLM